MHHKGLHVFLLVVTVETDQDLVCTGSEFVLEFPESELVGEDEGEREEEENVHDYNIKCLGSSIK